jgi:hypothetical protein
MNPNPFSQLLTFLERLDDAQIPYWMDHSRDDAVMVTASAPGEYWEIEFLENGEIEIERYRSNGAIYDASTLEEIFVLCSDEEPSVPGEVNQHDAITRK